MLKNQDPKQGSQIINQFIQILEQHTFFGWKKKLPKYFPKQFLLLYNDFPRV